jgi:hypothetical protein
MFRGMLLGMIMLIGGVYAADTMADANARPIVNWDVAAAKSIDAANFVRARIARLIDQAEATQPVRAERSAVNQY